MAIPQELSFLEPFIRELESLPPDELNEDVDDEPLCQALRDHVSGMSVEQADAELERLREAVKAWSDDSRPENGAAEWLHGYLSFPGIARELLRPPEMQPEGPEIRFNTPGGWEESRITNVLALERGTIAANIIAIDEFTFDLLLKQREQGSAPRDVPVIRNIFDVRFGDCHGKKYVAALNQAPNWKRVDYVLTVPGGYVMIWIVGENGEDFDESPLESRFDTLSLVQTA